MFEKVSSIVFNSSELKKLEEDEEFMKKLFGNDNSSLVEYLNKFPINNENIQK